MKMKKLFLLFVLAGAMPLSMMAQDDDLYFTPSKKVAKTSSSVENKPAYYVGSNRDVDEYNRRGKFRSTYQKIGVDSLGNDIIEFQAGTGIYPDSTYVDTMWVSPKQKYQDDEDYAYSRRMSRWDGYYGWYDPWFYGHWGYRPWGYWGWYNPWYYSYYGWYDPWYYGYYGYPWYYGWGPYDPWYYGYYGYGWGGYPGGTYYGTGVSGTRNHGLASYNAPRGTFNGSSRTFSSGTFGGSRSGSFGSRNSSSTVSSNNGIRVSRSNRSYSNSNGNFGGSRSTYTPSNSSSSPSYSAPARSSGSSYSGGGGGGGTFGGSRSGGGGGGGSRSGGGGFGGRR